MTAKCRRCGKHWQISIKQTLPDSTSDYAAEGTLAHSIAELKVRKKFVEPMGTRSYNAKMKKLEEDPLYQEEMQSCTDEYLDYTSGIVMSYPVRPYVTVERKWFTDGLKTFEGKEACELIQGVWIVEIGELEAFNKSEVGRIKQFLSQRIDRFRAAYGRHVQECPRCCVFFGTSNNGEYLRDPTGGRRFWPVDLAITKPTKSVFKDLDIEIDQLWAEAVTRWKLGEPLYLSGELERAAKEEQESHREHSTREGMILDFLDQRVPAD